MARDPMNEAGMNEYEMGLFTAIGQLLISVLEVGADANRLVRELRANQEGFFAHDKPQAGAMMGLLANAIDKAREPPERVR